MGMMFLSWPLRGIMKTRVMSNNQLSYRLDYRQPYPSRDEVDIGFRKASQYFMAKSVDDARAVAFMILTEDPITVKRNGELEVWSREWIELVKASRLTDTVPYDENRVIEILKVSEN